MDDDWKAFTEQYRKPNGISLGWRGWIGSDVVCLQCGCCLSTWVYKCPDCGQDRWKRSKLHAIGHRLRVLSWIPVIVMVPIGLLFSLALLALPPVLVLELAGLRPRPGWPWEWGLQGQILVVLGIAIEMGIIAAWKRKELSNITMGWVWLSVAIFSAVLLVTTAFSNFAFPHGPRYYVDSEPYEYGGGKFDIYEEDLDAVDIPGWVRFWRKNGLESSVASIMFVVTLAGGLAGFNYHRRQAKMTRRE